jgi:hypothetical protein
MSRQDTTALAKSLGPLCTALGCAVGVSAALYRSTEPTVAQRDRISEAMAAIPDDILELQLRLAREALPSYFSILASAFRVLEIAHRITDTTVHFPRGLNGQSVFGSRPTRELALAKTLLTCTAFIYQRDIREQVITSLCWLLQAWGTELASEYAHASQVIHGSGVDSDIVTMAIQAVVNNFLGRCLLVAGAHVLAVSPDDNPLYPAACIPRALRTLWVLLKAHWMRFKAPLLLSRTLSKYLQCECTLSSHRRTSRLKRRV